jgi:hypothetical protein
MPRLPNQRPSGLLVGSLAAIALTVGGCRGAYEPTSPADSAKALATLKSLPSLEDTQAQVQTVMTQITEAAKELFPHITWQTPHEGDHDNCERPYDQTDGQRYFLPDEVAANVDVSESNWAKIQLAAKDASAKLAATEVQVMKAGPRDHDVGFYGPTGLFIKVSYGGNLVVAGYTGCRLPRDKK